MTYDSDKAHADAVYARLMMESNAAAIRAKAPAKPIPKPTLRQRLAAWWRARTHGVKGPEHG